MEKEKMDIEAYLSEYEIFSEYEMSEITEKGIALKNGMYIDFAVCAEIWAKANGVERVWCVADRDASNFTFTFYTLPHPIAIKFICKGKLVELFSKNHTYSRFRELQKKIIAFGYTTFDMT